VLPRYAIQRFGAPRGGWQPPECEAGHCGIDLQQPRGTAVHAAADGRVLRAMREETPGRGRFLRLEHAGGQVITVYLHLDTIRADLRAGSPVQAGEPIGTVGSSGLSRGGAHLHFELAIRDGGAHRFIDPEPIVRAWPLPGAAGVPVAGLRAASLRPAMSPPRGRASCNAPGLPPCKSHDG